MSDARSAGLGTQAGAVLRWERKKSAITADASKDRSGPLRLMIPFAVEPGHACPPPDTTLIATVLPCEQRQVVVVEGPEMLTGDWFAQPFSPRHFNITSFSGA